MFSVSAFVVRQRNVVCLSKVSRLFHTRSVMNKRHEKAKSSPVIILHSKDSAFLVAAFTGQKRWKCIMALPYRYSKRTFVLKMT